MPLLNRHGVHIYYEVHGSGRPLLLSHGFGADSSMWRGQVPALAKEFKVIVWDMRGHGRSDYPDDPSTYSQAHMVGDIGALLDELCGGTIAILGGLSLGGYMSLAFCRAFPSRVAALLIMNAGPGFKKDAARTEWNRYANRTADELEQKGLSVLRSLSAERSTARHRNAKGLVLAARGLLTQQNSNVIEYLPNIKVPSLIVVGGNDTAFLPAAEYMAKQIPHAKKVVVRHAGHAVNIDQPNDFMTAVRPFLQQFGSPKASL